MPEIVVKLGTNVVTKHRLEKDVISAGRSRDNDIVLEHLSVSRHHTEIRQENGHWVVMDLNSANGTYVNGQKVTSVPLYHADTITIGKMHLHFFDNAPDQSPVQIHEYDAESTMVLTNDTTITACLSVTKGKNRGLEHVIKKDRTVIGRANDCDIQLGDWRMSKYHAQITKHGDKFVIEDLGTWGAIQINGTPVKQGKLSSGDEIQLGGTKLTFRVLDPGEMPHSEPIDDLPETPDVLSHIETIDEERPEYPEEEILINPEPRESDPFMELEQPVEEEPDEEDPVEALMEEAALDQEPLLEDDLDLEEEPAAEEPQASVDIEEPTPEVPAPVPSAPSDIPEEILNSTQYQMWHRAYTTGGPAMRKHAARQLEKLTGQPHEI